MLRCTTTVILATVLSLAAQGLSAAEAKPAVPWLGVHIMLGNNRAAESLIQQAPKLSALGVNVLVIEVNYNFAFKSHPELASSNGLTRDTARRLAKALRDHGIRPIPQFNCLGHQSWAARTAPLLTKYPQFDETPGQFPENKGIYCRSWCPQHPEVNPIVFSLMDELIDAVEADAFHVGMDEVFLIGSEHCQRCKGKDTAELFALALNDYHKHLVGQRKVEMLMWADRLLDAKATGYGKWEAADNGTHKAIDLIPKDIIMCDWHYTKREAYPSIPLFIQKGFRVWPGGWDKVDATEALMASAQQHAGPRMLGHMCTTWGKAPIDKLTEFPPLLAVSKKYQAGK